MKQSIQIQYHIRPEDLSAGFENHLKSKLWFRWRTYIYYLLIPLFILGIIGEYMSTGNINYFYILIAILIVGLPLWLNKMMHRSIKTQYANNPVFEKQFSYRFTSNEMEYTVEDHSEGSMPYTDFTKMRLCKEGFLLYSVHKEAPYYWFPYRVFQNQKDIDSLTAHLQSKIADFKKIG